MKKTFPYFISLLFFWMLVFTAFRVVFVIYHANSFTELGLNEIITAFYYALRLDLSTACLISLPTFLFITLYSIKPASILLRINGGITQLLLVIVSLLSVGNIKIYKEWGAQINARSLNYLLYPDEVLAFISTGELILLVLLFIICLYTLLKLFDRIVGPLHKSYSNFLTKITTLLFTLSLLIIGARGGLQQAPINESSSYHSNITILNHLATNNIWHLAKSVAEASDDSNQYEFMPLEEANARKEELFKTTEGNKNILTTTKPNIVFIVLESWTADLIEVLDGEKGVTPFFNELRKEGILFSKMYSSGSRTEQGLVSILSGFPSQPDNSIITTPDKVEQLPSISKTLANKGYSTSFYYGGEIDFANMKSYLLFNNFETIIDKHDYQKDQLNSKWGAHDEYVFDKQLDNSNSNSHPFLSVLLTLSTHEPFEVTINTPFNGSAINEQFKKAAYYTDKCLENYFTTAKQKEWYNNTLFILVADHGHHLPKGRDMNLPESHKITMLLYGDVLKDSSRNTMFEKVCNQHDIAATLLTQLNLPTEEYNWSRNVFNPHYKPFAYYANENTLGWISSMQSLVHNYTNEETTVYNGIEVDLNDSISKDGKAYLQSMYQQYLDY